MTVSATPVTLHGLRFQIAGLSEQGPRDENQDAFSVDGFEETGIVAVADGMGGEKSGRVAADTALRALLENGPIHSFDAARSAVRHADAAVAEAAERNPADHAGMGCALGLLALTPRRGHGPIWIAGHVGDVRILSRTPDGTLRLETRDHTPAFARWEAGEISLDEIADTAGANRLQRAVGRGAEADVTWIPARPGWSWLLVSDGIYKSMRLDELERALDSDPDEACEVIRRKVEERGPEDNYTAVIIRALPTDGAAPPSTHTNAMPHRAAAADPRSSRSAVGALATVLAIAALGLAGLALWRTYGDDPAEQLRAAEIQQLRTEVDSLRLQLQQVTDPFGPSEAPASALPPTTTPTGTTRP